MNKSGNRRGMYKVDHYVPAPSNHPWFRMKHGSAQFKTPEGYNPRCPERMCDGSGEIQTERGSEKCLCKTDKEYRQDY